MKTLRSTYLRGIFESCVIPFGKQGNVDVAVLREVLNYIFSQGGKGKGKVCFVNPAIAELQTLTDEERRKVMQTMLDVTGESVAIGAQGAIRPTVKGQIMLAKEAKKVGAAIFKFVPPRLNGGTTESERYQAIVKIMENVDISFLIYNTSNFGGVSLTPTQIVQLADKFDNFVVLESAELTHIAYLKRMLGNRLSCVSISEAAGLMSMVLGGDGYFSGNPLLLGKSITLYKLCEAGRFDAARGFYNKNYRLFSLGNFPV